jgi:hypothetical protein
MSAKSVSKIIYAKLLSQKEVENQTDTRRWRKSQQFGGGIFSSNTTFLAIKPVTRMSLFLLY